MGLSTLSVDHLRCIERVALELHPGHNLIWGDNASGKTSLLEAVFLLGRGRSFRTRSSERLIQHGRERLVVFGRTDGAHPQGIGVQVSRGAETIAKIDGGFVSSLAELTQVFAVQVIEPGVHRLIEEGGYRRRRWLDWGVFHVEPQFIDTWSVYTRALKQRNAALKTQPEFADAWDLELIRLGESIAESRGRFLDALQPFWSQMVANLIDREVELHYSRGWAQGVTLSEAFKTSYSRDRQRGITHSGPHRADLAIKLNGKLAREVLSRGQQKMTAIAMILAQLNLLKQVAGVTTTLLLDDPAAELDRMGLKRFAAQVIDLKTQLVVTALSSDLDPLGPPDRSFHVEQGRVQLV